MQNETFECITKAKLSIVLASFVQKGCTIVEAFILVQFSIYTKL